MTIRMPRLSPGAFWQIRVEKVLPPTETEDPSITASAMPQMEPNGLFIAKRILIIWIQIVYPFFCASKTYLGTELGPGKQHLLKR